MMPCHPRDLSRSIGAATRTVWAAIVVTLAAAAPLPAAMGADRKPADVDSKRLTHADREPGNWMSSGRTSKGEHFSPLNQITR